MAEPRRGGVGNAMSEEEWLSLLPGQVRASRQVHLDVDYYYVDLDDPPDRCIMPL